MNRRGWRSATTRRRVPAAWPYYPGIILWPEYLSSYNLDGMRKTLTCAIVRAKAARCRRHAAGVLILALCCLGNLYAAKNFKYTAAVNLGAWKEKVDENQCVLFTASMNSPDFSNLEETDGKQGPEFTKVGKPVRSFPDHVSVEVSATPTGCEDSQPPAPVSPPLVLPATWDLLAHLRFEVKWDMASGIRGIQSPAAQTTKVIPIVNDLVHYSFDLSTKGAPIGSRSIVSILAADGRKITDFELGF